MRHTSLNKFIFETILWCAISFGVAMAVLNWDQVQTFAKHSSKIVTQRLSQYFSPPAKPPLPNENAAEVETALNGYRVVVRSDENGHFGVRAQINHSEVIMLVDTGATYIALTYEDAQAIGLQPGSLDYTGVTQTANGVAKVAATDLDELQVGDIIIKDLKAFVMEEGAMRTSLLGMNFLRRLSKFQMAGRELILEQ